MNKNGMDTKRRVFIYFFLLSDNPFYLANLLPFSSPIFFLSKLWIYLIFDNREWTERGLKGPFLMKSILLGSWSAGKIMPS